MFISNSVVKKGTDFEWLKSMAKDKSTVELLIAVENWTNDKSHTEMGKNETEITLNFTDCSISMRKSDAWFQVMMITEILKYNDHRLLQNFSGENAKVVVNMGANIGLYTLKIKQQNPSCKVIAIEPNPSTFQILKKNIKDNHLTDVSLINKAIGSENGLVTFRVMTEASPLCGKYLGEIKKNQRKWIKQSMISELHLPMVTLNSVFEQYINQEIDILQMDVEEMELEILSVSKETLRFVKRIVVEWHLEDTKQKLITLLEKEGFRLIYEEPRDYGDLYFEK